MKILGITAAKVHSSFLFITQTWLKSHFPAPKQSKATKQAELRAICCQQRRAVQCAWSGFVCRPHYNQAFCLEEIFEAERCVGDVHHALNWLSWRTQGRLGRSDRVLSPVTGPFVFRFDTSQPQA
jgi:hypothetical protein